MIKRDYSEYKGYVADVPEVPYPFSRKKLMEVWDMAETKTLNLERIINILKEHKEELKERYGIKGIGVFGSYVRGEYKEKSDLDILVEFEEDADVDLLKFVNMENYLSELIGVKVDLVERSGLKPRIGKHILKEVIPVWKER